MLEASLTRSSLEGAQHSPYGQHDQSTHVLGCDGSQPYSGGRESQSDHDPQFGKLYNLFIFYVKKNL